MGRRTIVIDWIILILLFIIGSFGLFIQLTISLSLFTQQGIFLVLGFALLLVCARLDRIVLKWFAPFGYGIGILFLILTYFSRSVRGAARWIQIGGTQIQPSELAKPLFLLFSAWLISKYPPRELRFIPIHLAAAIVPCFLIFKQPDLGTAIVYASFYLAMLLAGGLSLRFVIVGAIFAGLVVPVFWNHLAPYQKTRFLTFVNPALDPKGAGYNALQSTIAVGSGQLFGRGLGMGTQSHLRFLPEHHTDFIFATLVEELGFAGGFLLFAAFFTLLVKILLFLKESTRTMFSFSYGAGVFGMLLSQVFINAGMNMGIVPITGITLPFVSYGGSSLLSICMSFGLLFALSSYRKESGRSIAIM